MRRWLRICVNNNGMGHFAIDCVGVIIKVIWGEEDLKDSDDEGYTTEEN